MAKKSKAKNGAKWSDKLIGTRIETITEKLSPMQVEKELRRGADIYRELDALESEKKKITSEVGAKIAARKAALRESMTTATSARRQIEITVEEWLTEKNEVIRVRTDTLDVLGTRNARVDELQEELDLEPEPTESADGPESGGFGGS